MCVCVCVCVYIYIYMCVCVYIYIYLYIYSTNIPPIMIINRIYQNQNLLSLYLVSFLISTPDIYWLIYRIKFCIRAVIYKYPLGYQQEFIKN